MHTIVRVAGPDLILRPAPVAMVWNEPGRPHDALAAPGVRLSPGEALVEVELATICGSDVNTVRGARPAAAPLVLGHEQVGRVVAVGEGAVRSDGSLLELGDRVVWSVTVELRRVRPLPSRPHPEVPVAREVRPRARAPRVGAVGRLRHPRAAARRARRRARVENSCRLVAAPASCATATAVAALDAASTRVRLDGTGVLVTGAGMIGLTVTALADRGRRDGDRRRIPMPRGGRSRARLGAIPVDPGGAVDLARAARRGARRVRAGRGIPEVLVPIEASGARVGRAAPRCASLGIGGVGGAARQRDARFRGAPRSRVARAAARHGHRRARLHGRAARACGRVPRAARGDGCRSTSSSARRIALAELDAALAEAATGEHVRVGVAPGRRV